MSTSSEFSSRKPSFSQKCSLLSQYIKEKGTFGNLSLGMTCNTESTTGTRELSLFPPTETSTTTMDLFPQQSGFMCHESKDVSEMADSRLNKAASSEPQAAQMTIFYAGKVIVFDNLPADQAKEVMLLASQGSSRAQTTLPHKMQTSFASNHVTNPIEAANLNPPRPIVSDLPIARRASLHRFLEKRKDRVTAKPYQQNSPAASSPQRPEESKSWLGLSGQSPQPFHC